jgi:hypothetical protein
VAKGARIVAGEAHRDGQTYGFVLYDAQDRACCYRGFTRHDADRAAQGGAGAAGDRVGVRTSIGAVSQ